MQKRNRKGFTLAELLIVVAIIAVLVAIAVPLFVGALDDAEKRVGEANCRAVRAAAVKSILLETKDEWKTDGELKGPWYAYAEVDANGEVSNLQIAAAEVDDAGNETEPTDLPLQLNKAENIISSRNGGWNKENGTYKVVVRVTVEQAIVVEP